MNLTSYPDAPAFTLKDHSVLVTGGTGSFGQRFVRRALEHSPKRIIVYSRRDHDQVEMDRELRSDFGDTAQCVRFMIGDVRDYARLQMALRDVDYVVHAAALKQVPVAEMNPFECVRTNVVGTENVMRASIHNRVKRVVFISSDKAVSPFNLYGATKLTAEKIVSGANHLTYGKDRTLMSSVRYGNVAGSTGSVIPLFRKWIKEGATSLPLTDPKMTRFWITLDEGVDLVLFALKNMRGGEIFVPHLPSFKIVDLMHALQGRDSTHLIGIRPGEKIHELLISTDESGHAFDMGDHYVIEPTLAAWERQQLPSTKQALGVGWRYASNSNPLFMYVDEIEKVLKQI